MGHDLDLALASLGDGDRVAQIARAAVHLDAVVQELLESGDVKDLVTDRLRAVDGVLISIILRQPKREIRHWCRGD